MLASIWLAIEMMPRRITSSVIGSSSNRSIPGCTAVATAILLSPAVDTDFVQPSDLEAVTGRDQRGRAVFLDHRRPFGRKTRPERGPVVDRRLDAPAREVDRTGVDLRSGLGDLRQPREHGAALAG